MAKKVDNATGKKNRIAQQAAGLPRGPHMVGFKGTKADDGCMCGGCNPKAKANHGRPKILRFK